MSTEAASGSLVGSPQGWAFLITSRPARVDRYQRSCRTWHHSRSLCLPSKIKKHWFEQLLSDNPAYHGQKQDSAPVTTLTIKFRNIGDELWIMLIIKSVSYAPKSPAGLWGQSLLPDSAVFLRLEPVSTSSKIFWQRTELVKGHLGISRLQTLKLTFKTLQNTKDILKTTVI